MGCHNLLVADQSSGQHHHQFAGLELQSQLVHIGKAKDKGKACGALGRGAGGDCFLVGKVGLFTEFEVRCGGLG